jgi:hypothetical protein
MNIIKATILSLTIAASFGVAQDALAAAGHDNLRNTSDGSLRPMHRPVNFGSNTTVSLRDQDALRNKHGALGQVQSGRTIDGVSRASREAAISKAVSRAMAASKAKRAAGK